MANDIGSLHVFICYWYSLFGEMSFFMSFALFLIGIFAFFFYCYRKVLLLKRVLKYIYILDTVFVSKTIMVLMIFLQSKSLIFWKNLIY